MQMTMDSTVKKQRRHLLGEYEKEIQIAMKKFQICVYIGLNNWQLIDSSNVWSE